MSFLGDIDLKAGIKKLQNTVMARSPLEIKVREATSNDPWGAPGTLKQEIAEATYNFEDSKLIMQTIWLRLADSGKNWRHVYKGLQLIEYLVGHGAERIIDECKDNINIIRSLKNFQYIDEKNKDVGQQVRELAIKTAKLLQDDASIVDMRKSAKKTKGKFEGISAEESRFHKGRGTYDDDRKKSKYDDDDSKPSYDEENYSSKKKKKSYDDDEEQQAPTPKKNDDEFDAKFDDDEEAAPAPTKPSPVASRPRAASGGKQPVVTKPAAPQPTKTTNNGLMDIDSFIGGDVAPTTTNTFKPINNAFYTAPQVIDPFEAPKPVVQQNTAALSNAFDDSWDAEFKEGSEQQTAPVDDKPKNELFGFTSSLVNFDTLDEKKKPTVNTSAPVAQQNKTKTMAELKAEKGGMIQPKQMTPTMPTYTAPATNFYPPQPQPQPFRPPQPTPAFGQPNPYGQPNAYGYPSQPQPFGQPNPYPNPAFRGYPPAATPQQQQPPMGRGNFNAFNF